MQHADAAPTGAAQARPFLVLHSSDDMYGADRMLLEVIAAIPEDSRRRVLVWLPSDYGHPGIPLCGRLSELGIAWEHADLPIVRRRYLNPRGGVELARRAAATRRRIAAVDPAGVLLATSAVLPVAPLLPRRSRVRVYLHMQEVWHGREARVLGLLARRVDRVVAISQASHDSLPADVRARSVVVPNATPEPDAWQPLDGRQGPLRFIVASRWNAWKGHRLLLGAWDEAGCPGRLVVLGGPPSMGESVDVAALAAQSRDPGTIEVLGEVPDPGPHIDDADVMVVPSTNPEPFGLVTIEAFARGRPVIGAAHGGLLETIQDGAGWLVAPGDQQALAHLMAQLTRDEVLEAGHRARQRYESEYSRRAFGRNLRAAMGLPDDPDVDTAGPANAEPTTEPAG